ncbi:MAG: hypothetical protein ACYC6Z_00115 [Thermoleophilia bacterium]
MALAIAAGISGCGSSGDNATVVTAPRTQTAPAATATTATKAAVKGITLDPGLQSITGVPSPAEMSALIALQQQVPYPLIVPTDLPSGYALETDLIGYGSRTAKDPVGYYSFRYSDPSNANASLTFNQSLSNSKPLSGYYLTEEEINGTDYLVYWHQTRDYLPQGDPVRTGAVGKAESFVVVWKGQYTDPVTGQPQELWYNMTSGTWTTSWDQIRSVLESLKPLSDVAQP